MGSYVGLFALLFVGIIGAITLIVREDMAGERARDEAVAYRSAATPPVTTDPAERNAPRTTGATPRIPHPV